jgi:Uma2 family endonuclease
MNALLTPPAITPDDLLRLPDDGHTYELVDGKLKELPVSKESSRIAGEVYFALRTFTAATPLGWVYPEGTSYQCFVEPNRVRKPDTSFVSFDRMPLEGYEDEGHIAAVPDLVVEVISPNDIAADVAEKIAEWLAAGVRVLWEVFPATQTVREHRPDGIRPFRATDTLTLPDLLPGFSVPVASLFRRPGEPVPTS